MMQGPSGRQCECGGRYVDTNGTIQLIGSLAVVLGGTTDVSLVSPANTTPCHEEKDIASNSEVLGVNFLKREEMANARKSRTHVGLSFRREIVTILEFALIAPIIGPATIRAIIMLLRRQ